MERSAELEILIASLRRQIERQYEDTNHFKTKEFISLYSYVKSLQIQLDTYILEYQSLTNCVV